MVTASKGTGIQAKADIYSPASPTSSKPNAVKLPKLLPVDQSASVSVQGRIQELWNEYRKIDQELQRQLREDSQEIESKTYDKVRAVNERFKATVESLRDKARIAYQRGDSRFWQIAQEEIKHASEKASQEQSSLLEGSWNERQKLWMRSQKERAELYQNTLLTEQEIRQAARPVLSPQDRTLILSECDKFEQIVDYEHTHGTLATARTYAVTNLYRIVGANSSAKTLEGIPNPSAVSTVYGVIDLDYFFDVIQFTFDLRSTIGLAYRLIKWGANIAKRLGMTGGATTGAYEDSQEALAVNLAKEGKAFRDLWPAEFLGACRNR